MSIFISDKARQKLHIAANMLPNDEVSGFGKTELVEGGLLVTDIVIPPQEVGGAHVEIKAATWQQFVTDVISGKYSEDGSNGNPLDYRVWWHKHPGSGKPGPSGVDTNSLKWLAGEVGFGYMVGIIISARAEQYYAWLSAAPPNVPYPLNHADIDVSFPLIADLAIREVVAEQMKEVKTSRSGYTPPGGRVSGGHHHKDVDGSCFCNDSTWSHRPGTQHKHKSWDCYCVKGVEGGTQAPLLTAGRSGGGSTTPSDTRFDRSIDPATIPSHPDWTLVKGIEKYTRPDGKGGVIETSMVEITYKSGTVMLVPDKGQLDAWVAWLAKPVPPHGGTQAPPPPVKKPGERAPKAIKKRIHENARKYNIVPLLDGDDHSKMLTWNAGVKGVEIPLMVDNDNSILLGYDDEGDPVMDLYDGDEQWVYYDINARAIDRSGIDDNLVAHLSEPKNHIAYLRGKYIIPPEIEDDDVKEYVAVMFNEIDETDDDGTEDVGGVPHTPLTVDESK